MTLLTEPVLRDLYERFQRENTETIGITKPELYAAFEAVDAYIESVLPGFYQAFTGDAATMTPTQKKHIASLIVRKRFEV